jgi:hypothetical protein
MAHDQMIFLVRLMIFPMSHREDLMTKFAISAISIDIAVTSQEVSSEIALW